MNQTLDKYRHKRDFKRTGEPAGTASGRRKGQRGDRLDYVVQRHQARSLHYDFRLEIDGVLVS